MGWCYGADPKNAVSHPRVEGIFPSPVQTKTRYTA